MQETFGSVCHGAGRLLSRTAAKKGRNAKQVEKELEERGVIVRSESRDGILEEIPEAYKNVDEVIDVVHRAGLAKKVARLRPMGVIRGWALPASYTALGGRIWPTFLREDGPHYLFDRCRLERDRGPSSGWSAEYASLARHPRDETRRHRFHLP